MTYSEDWNYIVSKYNELYNSQENSVQREWEDYFLEIFGYSRRQSEIDSQRSIHIGSRERVIPDIIINTNGQDLFDIELKQYHLSFSKEMENQLISYLKLLRISVGILVCQKIYVYVYNLTSDKVKKIEIPFIKDNSDGIKFVQLFQKENFSKECIEEFIDSKSNFDKNIARIKNELTSENVLELVKLYFQDKYSTEEIDLALKDVSIEIKAKGFENSADISNAVDTNSIKKNGYNDSVVYEEPNFNYVIIKTKNSTVAERGSLYEATRYRWSASDRITHYSFVISVIDAIVQKVYIVDRWQKSGDRWEFFGREASGEDFQKLIGKKIPEKYRKKGMASPVVYKKPSQ